MFMKVLPFSVENPDSVLYTNILVFNLLSTNETFSWFGSAFQSSMGFDIFIFAYF